MLLYQDERGLIAAKIYGGTYDVKHKRESTKIKVIFNTFGVYDHTNDKMYIHCYRNKTSKQFIDFIGVDSKLI
ncbi:MAG: hypothetical protein R3321_07925 [Nitrososphaeraceae archaeon]|nr:hypothetical protein [Nitrososphaeraceae archaeon]